MHACIHTYNTCIFNTYTTWEINEKYELQSFDPVRLTETGQTVVAIIQHIHTKNNIHIHELLIFT